MRLTAFFPSLNVFPPHMACAIRKDAVRSDTIMLGLVFFNWLVVSSLSAYAYKTYMLGLIGGGVLMLLAAAGFYFGRGSLFTRSLLALCLISMSFIMIQQHLGRIEMHFHIFVLLAFLVIYKDAIPLLFASVFVAVHHTVANYLQSQNMEIFGEPVMLFSYGCGFDIVLLHSAFVMMEALVLWYFINRTFSQFIENKELVRNLMEASGTIESGVEKEHEIIESATGLGDGARDILAKTLSQSEVTDKDISEAKEQLSGASKNIGELAVYSKENAQQGEVLNSKMEDLADAFERINSIFVFIADIAKQTNLLALNAGVEAARAGKEGLGFNIIAEEVRELSNLVQERLKETGTLGEAIAETLVDARRHMKSSAELSAKIIEASSSAEKSIEESHALMLKSREQFFRSIDDTQEIAMVTDDLIREINAIHELSLKNMACIKKAADLGSGE